MTAPHRGLPPPAAMALPAAQSPGLGTFPREVLNSDQTLLAWIHQMQENEKRLSEVERTKQEELRLEVRKTEHRILQDALGGGVPGPLVALMFAGASVKSATTEFVNQYVAELYHHQRPQIGPLPPAPELRRETRSVAQHQHPPHMPPPIPAGAPREPMQQLGYPQPLFSPVPPARGSSARSSQAGSSQLAPSHTPSQHRGSLPRVATSDIQQTGHVPHPGPSHNPLPPMHHQPPQPGPPSAPAPEPPQPREQQGHPILFHHWQPPAQTTGTTTPQQKRESPPRQLESPFTHHPPSSHLTGPDVVSSPKRRRTATGSQPNFSSSVSSQTFSPPHHVQSGVSSTPGRRRAHSRQRSDTTPGIIRGFEPYHKPPTRQRRSGSGPGDEEYRPQASEGSTGPTGEVGSALQQQMSGLEQGQQHSQPHHPPTPQQQPPSRPYSAGPDSRNRELPYPVPPGHGGEAQPQAGNGRH